VVTSLKVQVSLPSCDACQHPRARAAFCVSIQWHQEGCHLVRLPDLPQTPPLLKQTPPPLYPRPSSHSMGPSPSPSCLAQTSTIYIYNDNLVNDSLRNLTKRTNQRESRIQPSFLTLPLNTIWSFDLGPHALFTPSSCIHVPLDMFPTLDLNPCPL
jgi:hypothetical protein